MYSKDGTKIKDEVSVALHPSPTSLKTSVPPVNMTASNILIDSYVHQLDRKNGVLSTYQVTSIEYKS
jgi:hypothetical protein